MPRPETRTIQLTIDGREVRAAEGAMLVDAAKQGDVEIPYFCYEPKLGNPVGACRMCLVEIEGIPKLQTSCSTPVKDGMVVHTQTQRVKHAQNAIVEFLLVNHPLDCPVCDKGGECPLQDITFGWGLGRSRFIEPKRHFVKPLALSPLVAIDRERCILCYRRGLPADLRRARGTHVRRHPRRTSVRRTVQRQHHRAVPRRRADLAAVPLPRAAVGHRGRRWRLHPVPIAVQCHVHGPRRESDARARARQR
jgi:aerobic-type carbon monoxide dehydrogenase small subunit (CoxS/CutS family)